MGRLDVDNLLEELTPQQFDEWYAAYRAGLFRDEWEQAGIIAAEVRNGFGAIRRGLNDKSITDDYFVSASDYDPTRDKTQKNNGKIDQDSIDRAQTAARQKYGGCGGNHR